MSNDIIRLYVHLPNEGNLLAADLRSQLKKSLVQAFGELWATTQEAENLLPTAKSSFAILSACVAFVTAMQPEEVIEKLSAVVDTPLHDPVRVPGNDTAALDIVDFAMPIIEYVAAIDEFPFVKVAFPILKQAIYQSSTYYTDRDPNLHFDRAVSHLWDIFDSIKAGQMMVSSHAVDQMADEILTAHSLTATSVPQQTVLRMDAKLFYESPDLGSLTAGYAQNVRISTNDVEANLAQLHQRRQRFIDEAHNDPNELTGIDEAIAFCEREIVFARSFNASLTGPPIEIETEFSLS